MEAEEIEAQKVKFDNQFNYKKQMLIEKQQQHMKCMKAKWERKAGQRAIQRNTEIANCNKAIRNIEKKMKGEQRCVTRPSTSMSTSRIRTVTATNLVSRPISRVSSYRK